MIKSAGGIVYFIEKNQEPKFLILKRHSLSWKIEWVAPKWKIKPSETAENAAIREVSEETGIPINLLENQWYIWTLHIHLESEDKWKFDKSIDYFLLKFLWNPNKLNIPSTEWYLWVYKRATINEIFNLIYYPALRDIFYKAYNKIKNTSNAYRSSIT